MIYEKIKKLDTGEFRRYTGIHNETFEKMIKILKVAENKRRKKGGHKSKLCMEDMLLLTLEYLRENRTYFHIAQNYGIHETTAIRICRWVENTLIKSGSFSLPGKKVLAKSDVEFDLILVDATEVPIERPKKTEKNVENS
jgi:hypothetical protein